MLVLYYFLNLRVFHKAFKEILISILLLGFWMFAFVSTVAATPGIISTVAGTDTGGFSGDGGAATSASLNFPRGVFVDGSGNIYIADASNHRIRKVNTSGIMSTVTGNGTGGFSGDGGSATTASLNEPYGVFVDGLGNIYIADTGNARIRKVDTSADTITTVAGNGTFGFSGDVGPATSASLHNPSGVFVDGSGIIYIADRQNQRIRKVDTSGVITTVAGNGTAGFSGDVGPATDASLNEPSGVFVDGSGNIYIADLNNHRIRKVDTSGVITTVAGNGTGGFSGDGGTAISASLSQPLGVFVDGSGVIYIADENNDRIRKVGTSGVITTVAGDGTPGFSGDGGTATDASLNSPSGVFVDGLGNIYITDRLNHRIRKVVEPPAVTSIDPASGPELGGTPVTIKGSSFQSGATVSFDGITADSVVVASDTVITAVTPAHPADTVDVIVTNPDGQADTLSGGFEFVAVIPLAVNDTASTPQGSAVTVDVLANDSDPNGDPLTVISITDPPNGSAAIDPGDTTVTYTPDVGFSGNDTLQYVISDGANTDSALVIVTVTPAPDVVSISPAAGTKLGATSVTIIGSGFMDGAALAFGDSSATDIIVSSDSVINATTPAHAVGNVDVIVTNPNGLVDTLEAGFTFLNAIPLANAGQDQIVNANVEVALDGSGSSDADGDSLSFNWMQIAGTAVSLSSSSAVSPTFLAPAMDFAEIFSFKLTVDDGLDASLPDTVNVVVEGTGPPPPVMTPAGLSALGGDSEVSLNWSPNTQGIFDHFILYRSTTKGFVPTPSDSIAGPTSNIYTDAPLSNGTKYYYRVAAVDTLGDRSGLSDEAHATPLGFTFADDFADLDEWIIGEGSWTVGSALGSSTGNATLWNRLSFAGDTRVRFQANTVAPDSSNINVIIYGNGSSANSGYKFIFGGDGNTNTKIQRLGFTLAERNDLRIVPGVAYNIQVEKVGRQHFEVLHKRQAGFGGHGSLSPCGDPRGSEYLRITRTI